MYENNELGKHDMLLFSLNLENDPKLKRKYYEFLVVVRTLKLCALYKKFKIEDIAFKFAKQMVDDIKNKDIEPTDHDKVALCLDRSPLHLTVIGTTE